MNVLIVEQMEKIEAGKKSQRQCALAGAAILATAGIPKLWGAAIAITVMNADCF